MRLIDADKLLQSFEDEFTKVRKNKLSENDYLIIRTAYIALSKFIEKQPTAYDPDNIVKQLEDYGNEEMEYYRNTPYEKCIEECVHKAIEVVKAGCNVNE